MQLVYPDDGLLHQLKLIANNNGNGLLWQLYQNDIDPQLDSVLADFTLADATWGRARLSSSPTIPSWQKR